MELNSEKLDVLKHDGNTLVIANPGTGKTLLLACKYAQLVREGVKPQDILCLTFTNKAKKEMEERIIGILKEQGMQADYANLNIFTFHAYALEEIGREETVPGNLLRYSIYKYFKENETLRYDDGYLIGTIVPKMENLIRYLKSFGVLPDDIDVKQVKARLSDFKKLSKEEMDKFAECFIDIYRHYEEVKKGIDYADMLMEFMKLRKKRKFKHVLVDELQDVNTIEADIALESGETFFAVGDKKQAIFGFQGGSALNFNKFNAKTFVLTENFRSTNAILDYAKEYLVSKTKDERYKEELKGLRNPRKPDGAKPTVYETTAENTLNAVCELTNKLRENHTQIAIIARTNLQILRISQELEKRGIEHSSTYFSASNDARTQIITFLKGILSNEPNNAINAMFTPFAPISLQDAFELTKLEKPTLDKICEKSPEFRQLRESIKTIQDTHKLFNSRILPIAVTYGKEYLLAAMAMHKSLHETTSVLDTMNFNEVINYLQASDLLTDESDTEKQVVLTTVHKAKGRQFPTVIYAPKKMRDNDNFQDEIVKTILKTKGLDAEEELNEEALRINFVALTRAEQDLYIIPDKTEEYLNNHCQKTTLEVQGLQSFETTERLKRAYALFVNGNTEQSQKLLTDNNAWVTPFIKKHFDSLDHVSFSSLENDPCEYLYNRILKIRESSPALSLGSQVHKIADSIIKGQQPETTEKTRSYAENINAILLEVRRQYPENAGSEQKIRIPLQQLTGNGEGINFVCVIDAVFKNGENRLILDWKTDKDEGRGAEHRQQLEAYKRAYSVSNSVPLDKIRVAIGYVGLRPTVNLGKTNCRLDSSQPSKTAFETFSKKVNTVLEWRNNPETFLQHLKEKNCDDPLINAITEQHDKEKHALPSP